jgi:hypothetical protein
LLDDVVIKKCFTKVVLLGSNKCKVPEDPSSFAFPTLSAISKKAVLCAKSKPALYERSVVPSSSVCCALIQVVVFVAS